jgi:hypothetical protein
MKDLSEPGIEPGSARPQRAVLTTSRLGRTERDLSTPGVPLDQVEIGYFWFQALKVMSCVRTAETRTRLRTRKLAYPPDIWGRDPRCLFPAAKQNNL